MHRVCSCGAWNNGKRRFCRKCFTSVKEVVSGVIDLVLTYYWYDEVASGRKRIEYREIKPYWTKRILERKDEIEAVCFRRGYTKRGLVCPVAKIDIGPCPYEGFDGDYIRIHLGLK